MTDIPIIETARLRLRAHRVSDLADCLALWSEPETVRFIGGQPFDEQAVWIRLLRYAGLWSLMGYGFWAFEDRVTGRFLGEGGLMDARRGIALLDGVPEIGWALVPDAAGRGLATEAVAAITCWADNVLGEPVTRCIIEPGNIASLRVAAKAGYADIARIESRGTPLLVLERARGPVS